MSNPSLSNIARTMIFTLRARADEQARPDRLFRDEQAVAWLKQVSWDEILD